MLRILSAVSGLAAIGFALAAFDGTAPIYMPVCAAMVAVILIMSGPQPKIMRFLTGLFSLSFLCLSAITLANSVGLVPAAAEPYLPPSNAAIIATLLALLNFIVSYIPMIRVVIDLADPYFETQERGVLDLGWLGRWRMRESWIGLGLFGVIIGLNVFQVYLSVLFNFWNNRFYTALQDKNVVAFWAELGYFTVVATIWITRSIAESYLTEVFQVHWRQWMTNRYVSQWLGDKVHYRLGLEAGQTDNPDQRISEDVRDFIENTTAFYISIFNQCLTLYAFVQILWGISAQFPYRVGSLDLATIPGYLVWVVLLLAVIVTFGTHIIGRPLIPLNFARQRVEADFRYNLVRVRENSEQIALLDGEETERASLMTRFWPIFVNTIAIAVRRVKLNIFTVGYAQALIVLPYVLLAPAYFTTESMKLGFLTQTADAFGNVQQAFSFFITAYAGIAAYKAIINRLTSFDSAIARAEMQRSGGIRVEEAARADGVQARDIDIDLPTGRPLLRDANIAFRRGERTLVTGPSGSGKTTLFRALAGIWPFGSGKVSVPRDESVMLLPQQPYLPLGTLRAALTYPAPETAFSEAEVARALAMVGLAHKTQDLAESQNWSNALSGGEKQRVALARAILQKPKWLFLDEATSALDETAEAALYRAIGEALPDTTVISIGHRSSLAVLHDRRVAIEPEMAGGKIVDKSLESFAAGRA
jgi:vitamin B12/bleomycin/antimicrobial peptide transport system ATP-binding/permease protein